MEQFNLEKYLKNREKKIVTRDGRNMRIICTDCKGDHPIVGLIDNGCDNEILISFNNDGYAINENHKSDDDIFFAPTKKTGWVVVSSSVAYPSISTEIIVYETYQEAKNAIPEQEKLINTYTPTNYFKYYVAKIEWEE